MRALVLAAVLLVPTAIHARSLDTPNMPLACIGQAADEFGLPPKLLHALYLTEGGRLGWAMRNPNGTLDHGPFQINTIHLKQLSRYGIDGRRLASDPHVNARVAAWRLRSEIILAGGNVWRGVGNYRSRTPKYHNEEISRVARNYRRLPDLDYQGICNGAAR